MAGLKFSTGFNVGVCSITGSGTSSITCGTSGSSGAAGVVVAGLSFDLSESFSFFQLDSSPISVSSIFL